MIVSKTPFRISFFGGGSDYPAWYLKEGGTVLSTTFDKYCYITCRFLPPFFAHKYRIVWSHIENVSSISEILHPAVRAGLTYLEMDKDMGVEIHHQGDLPARSGMGSSSAFAVGLIKAVYALKGKMIGKHELALKAIDLEQNVLKEAVGSQDQVATAYGGFNKIEFYQSGKIEVQPVTIPPGRLNQLNGRLIMIYTGSNRLSSEFAGQIISNLQQKAKTVQTMREMVDKAIAILNSSDDLDAFGDLLNETWMLKQSLAKNITNNKINSIYQTALKNGALGGKLLGAGSTGFMVFYVPIQKQPQVNQALANYLQIPFQFENEGSTIIHYRPDAI